MVNKNAYYIGAGVGGAVVGGTIGYLVARKNNKRAKSRSSSTRKTKSKSNGKRNKIKGRRYTPHTAGKRRDTSRKRIRYTKNGQPYIIKADGRARFISMKSAKSSHKRKGGKY